MLTMQEACTYTGQKYIPPSGKYRIYRCDKCGFEFKSDKQPGIKCPCGGTYKEVAK